MLTSPDIDEQILREDEAESIVLFQRGLTPKEVSVFLGRPYEWGRQRHRAWQRERREARFMASAKEPDARELGFALLRIMALCDRKRSPQLRAVYSIAAGAMKDVALNQEKECNQ